MNMRGIGKHIIGKIHPKYLLNLGKIVALDCSLLKRRLLINYNGGGGTIPT